MRTLIDFQRIDWQRNLTLVRTDWSGSPSNPYQHLFAMCSLVRKGILVLVGTSNKASFNSANNFCQRTGMPFLTSSSPPFRSWTPQEANNSFTLFMKPPILQAVVDVIKNLTWDHFFYVYNHDDGLKRAEVMSFIFRRDNIKLKIFMLRISNLEKCHKSLKQLDKKKTEKNKKNFVIDVPNHKTLQILLKKIQAVGMNRSNYHYLLCTLALAEVMMPTFTWGGAKVLGFNLPTQDPKERGKELKLKAALVFDTINVIKNAMAKLKKNNNNFNNLLSSQKIECRGKKLTSWKEGRMIRDAFKSVSFIGNTGNVAFDNTGHRKNYSLLFMAVARVKQDGTPVVTKEGIWNSVEGLKLEKENNEGKNSSNQCVNKMRIVVSIMESPYMMKRILKLQDREAGVILTGNNRYEGYCADLAKMIAKRLKFHYKIEIVIDGKYGEKQKNGSWNGMVGVLSRKEADMAIAPMTISAVRERVLDFSKPFMNLGISIMIKKPDKQKPGVFSFMDPLSYNVWLCIIFAYLGVSLTLFLVSRFSPNEWQIEDSEKGPAFVNDLTLLNSLWFSLGAFMRRGCEVCPRSIAGRVVGSAWWFFTLIIISSYTANLAAFLTIERMFIPIKNAEDLAKQTEIQYGTLDAGSTKEFFRTSRVPIYEKMWNYMSATNGVFVKEVEDGIQKVKNSKGKYAFLLESSMNDYANQRKPCDTMKVGDNLDSKGYGVATYIGSDLREKINVAVLELVENESLQKLHKKWWYDKGECIVESESKNSGSSRGLSLSNVAGIFYILISGLCLSLIAASFEFYYKYKVEVKRRKKRSLNKSTKNNSCFYENPKKYQQAGHYVYITPCAMTTIVNISPSLDTNNKILSNHNNFDNNNNNNNSFLEHFTDNNLDIDILSSSNNDNEELLSNSNTQV